MKMRKRTSLNMVASAVLSLGMTSCATIGPSLTYVPRPFTASNVGKLLKGLPGDSLIAMFGSPDSTYVLSFGEKTERPWQGIAWRYLVERDTNYVFVERPMVNTFYLYESNQGLLLHHWVIEKEVVGRPRP